MQSLAGIGVAYSLRREGEREVQRHGFAGRRAFDMELDAELRSGLAVDVGGVRHEVPVGYGADCAGRRLLPGLGRRAGRPPGKASDLGDGNAGDALRRLADTRRLRRGAAGRRDK